MSQTETHFGTMVQIHPELTPEEICKIIVQHDIDDINEVFKYYDSYQEYIESESEEYLIRDNKVYVIDNTETETDIGETWVNQDKSIGYVVSFYNGSCGFKEALNDALDNTLDDS